MDHETAAWNWRNHIYIQIKASLKQILFNILPLFQNTYHRLVKKYRSVRASNHMARAHHLRQSPKILLCRVSGHKQNRADGSTPSDRSIIWHWSMDGS